MDGKVTLGDGREFTRLLGGFGEGEQIIMDKQVAELINYVKEARGVRHRTLENIKHFVMGLHIIDFKIVDSEQSNNFETLKSIGYTNMEIAKAKNIYGYSKAGFLLYLINLPRLLGGCRITICISRMMLLNL